MQAALSIASSLSVPGISDYLNVLKASFNATTAFAKQYGEITAGSCVKSLIETVTGAIQGVFQAGGRPLSPDWFIANCPALDVYLKKAHFVA